MSSGVVSQRTSTTLTPSRPRSSAVSASNTTLPVAAPGEALSPSAITSTGACGSIIGWRRWSSCLGSIRTTASSREISPSRTMSTAIRSAAAAVRLPPARLEQVEPVLLDGELDVLHLAEVLLEPLHRLEQLCVRRGKDVRHSLERLRRSDAGHDVLALGVREELAERFRLAGRRVAGERHSRRRRLALVAEHHLDDVRSGAEIVRNPVGAAVDLSPRRVPGVEDRPDCVQQLRVRVARELVARRLAVDALEAPDQLAQPVLAQLEVAAGSLLVLETCQLPLEAMAIDAVDDLAVHLEETPVGVQGESRVAGRPARAPRPSSTFRPRLRIVSIIPGIEIAAPERTETSSGSLASPNRFPVCSSSRATLPRISSSRPLGNLPPERMYSTQTSVVTTNPVGTGIPSAIICASPAPLPPRSDRLSSAASSRL